MTVNAILACDAQGGIGKDNALPWPRNKADMKWFQDCTDNDTLIMGRSTWDSIGSKKLKNRRNVVMTSQIIPGPDNIYKGHIKWVLKQRKRLGDKKIWIIGGSNLFHQSWNYVDNVYLTLFEGIYSCDRFINLDFIKNKFPVLHLSAPEENLKFVVRSK